MIDPQVAFDKLSQFQTKEEIAEYFQSEGVRGWPKASQSCPIAKFMTRHTGLVFHVGASSMVLTDDGVTRGYAPVFSLTSAMQNFVSSFDVGNFPNLYENCPNPSRNVVTWDAVTNNVTE